MKLFEVDCRKWIWSASIRKLDLNCNLFDNCVYVSSSAARLWEVVKRVRITRFEFMTVNLKLQRTAPASTNNGTAKRL